MKAGIWNHLDANKGLKKVHPNKWSGRCPRADRKQKKWKPKKTEATFRKRRSVRGKDVVDEGFAKRRNSDSLTAPVGP